MPKDKKYRRKINYTNRDFDTIKKDLIEQARRYYPDSYRDFSDASFGSLMLDSVAYIGDQLSFYMDYNINEAFMDTANEFNNIVRHAKQFGYRYEGRSSAMGEVALFVLVPASSTGLGPNRNYMPILRRGAQLTSSDNANFIVNENVDFSDPKHSVVVARTNASTGLPTYYAIKAYAKVISGAFSSENIVVNEYQPYYKATLSKRDISEIISVIDSEGHEYFEVDFLSQDVIYREVANQNAQSDNVPSLLKPFAVPRRFVVDRQRVTTSLQFGYGSDSEITSPSVVEPTDVVLDMFGKSYTTDTAFDPANLIKTDKFGVSPANTTLTVSYRMVGPNDTNAGVGTVTSLGSVQFEFPSVNATDNSLRSTVMASLEVTNEEPIVGNVSLPTRDEIKRRSHDYFATQNRAVTKSDYEALIYNMPKQFGTVKRCNIVRDHDSLKRNLNLYVISEDSRGKLQVANNTIKENIKTHLSNYKMLNDTIDILDAYIVNIAIDFEIIASEFGNKFAVLDACLRTLRNKYASHNYIGEDFSISDIYQTLNKVSGVIGVSKVKVRKQNGANYSSTKFMVDENLTADGRSIRVPKNVILEIKYLKNDIKGSVK
jgi:hypothetical protein